MNTHRTDAADGALSSAPAYGAHVANAAPGPGILVFSLDAHSSPSRLGPLVCGLPDCVCYNCRNGRRSPGRDRGPCGSVPFAVSQAWGQGSCGREGWATEEETLTVWRSEENLMEEASELGLEG